MNTIRFPSANLLIWTFRFWLNHIVPISFLMLFAALGRAIQMHIFGSIPLFLAVALEFVVELARITTLLVIIGHGNLSNGIQKVVGIFRFSREQWSGFSRAVRRTFSQQWTVLLWNLLLFSLVAYAFNWANGVIADHSSVLLFLKDNGFMNESASGMPVFFFLKNLTVVPFTLVFDYILLRWLTGKLTFAGLTVQTGA
jgi:hypothetical protein